MSKVLDRESQEILELFRQRNYYRDTAVEMLAALKMCQAQLQALSFKDSRITAALERSNSAISKAEGGAQ